ncbi:urease accessory protein UreH domain-containing protein [Lentiprolixibacter aurantiacus]|uniref:Sulfite exporter TauE/SafE family protein n=1 Tax=Lentiprolixibacter aurantiacus TaxID=2993939 RepID=A0AAE3MP00_9FLAO|nr:sulfite exporter TauE/SafE family protein [Lentiprolixibacter aurantiacus]MCX2720369.1 sulfite exporter TauE/SafE family protein [Lentiprolixibacter aurantiacus]
MEATLPITAGLITSMLHVISGPDHLAAVTPFAIESKKKAWKIGLSWSMGHLAGMMAIGLLFTAFGELIPIEAISAYSEQLVGIVLVGVGVAAIFKIFRKKKDHSHLHVHSENAPLIHSHEHDHSREQTHRHVHPKNLKQSNKASFSIGLLHGFAGIAHFLLFLPILGFETRSESITYIAGFGFGIIIAMVAYAIVVGQIAAIARNGHNEVFFKGIRLAGGLFAVIVGVYWFFAASA